jgi:hypothetical protein
MYTSARPENHKLQLMLKATTSNATRNNHQSNVFRTQVLICLFLLHGIFLCTVAGFGGQ